MKEVIYTVSTKEIGRLDVIQKAEAKQLKRKKAADLLGLSTRQVIRLIVAYRREGPAGLISKHRGQKCNRRHKESFKSQVLKQVREHYHDFGPQLASEKLWERHQLKINKETLRQWMIEAGLHKARPRKGGHVHQQRTRRSCLGEMIQIDGSPHDWFEGRRAPCSLLVFVDDATSRLMALRFVESETTQGYFDTMRDHLKRHGRPVSVYSDKHGVFRINASEAKTGTGETQFGRAMRELDIKLICANTPQAKGRVERSNSTLQNRLVKEMRLRGINDIETANAFLPIFIEGYNKRFGVEPANPTDAHRQACPDEEALDLIFSFQCDRKLSKNLELSYQNNVYQVQTKGEGYAMHHAKVRVCDDQQGGVTLIYKNRLLHYHMLHKRMQPTPIVDAKQINHTLDVCLQKVPHTTAPKADHPWRLYGQIAQEKRKWKEAQRSQSTPLINRAHKASGASDTKARVPCGLVDKRLVPLPVPPMGHQKVTFLTC